MVFRVTKGNAVVHIKQDEDKAIYILIYPECGNIIKKKLQKV